MTDLNCSSVVRSRAPLRSRHVPSGSAAFVASILVVLAACSSGGGDTTGTSGTTATGTAGSGGATGSGGGTGTGGGMVCPGPGYAGNPTSHLVASADAMVVGLDGNPAADVPVYVCGTNICSLPVKSGQDGHAHVTTGGQMFVKPGLKYGDGIITARFVIPLPDGTDVVLGTVVAPALPPLASGAPIVAGKDVSSGGVTLSIAPGTSIDIDTLTFEDPEQQKFRAVEVPIDKAPALDPSLGFSIVYALAPYDTFLCPAAKLTVPNDAGWPAGTAVEFFVHGTDAGENWAPWAGWAKVSDGQVSADGKTISTVEGGGLPELSAFGIRKKSG